MIRPRRLEALDLALVAGNQLLRRRLVHNRLGLDALRLVRVPQRRDGLGVAVARRAQRREHERLGVAGERVLQQVGELGLPERDYAH